jgi:A/G-specific adenine glycosylase
MPKQIPPSDNARTGRKLVATILRWYSRQGRTLPWRNISDPYRILVSEIMLQQTGVGRVLEKYPEFIRTFPSFKKLASARQRDVVVAWRGMGYNNRAVRLHRLAQIVVTEYRGRLPSTFEELLALPGIGRYTANALLLSVHKKRVAIVDVNIQRVLSRIFRRMKSTADMLPHEEVWQIAESLVPVRRAYDWGQAQMDLGATICTARTPGCRICPVASLCKSRIAMKRPKVVSPKSEPSKNGIPNRIYRGKIVDILRRRRDSRSIPIDTLGGGVLPQYSSSDRDWLESLLHGLERDGLIKRARSGNKGVSLA